MTAIFANNRAPQTVALTNGKLFIFLHSKEIVTDPEIVEELRLLASDTKNYGHLIEMRKWNPEDVITERTIGITPEHTATDLASIAAEDLLRRAIADEKEAGTPPILYKGREWTGAELTAHLERLKTSG